MFIPPSVLVGKRVLVVEDEFAVAVMIEDFLMEFGCVPVGPCTTVAKALDAVIADHFDLAMLDVNLSGEMVYPVAYALDERRIPFLFVTGYGEAAAPPERPNWKVCQKPFRGDHLGAMLAALINEP